MAFRTVCPICLASLLALSTARTGQMHDWAASERADYRQALLHRSLRRAVDGLRQKAPYHLQPGEYWALFLWVRNHSPKQGAVLDMWGSSWAFYPDRLLAADDFRSPLSRTSDYLAVTAANTGTVVSMVQQESTSRWMTQLAVPVFLSEAPWHRLLVGVVTFGASALWDESTTAVLGQLVVDEANSFGIKCLDPSVPLSEIATPDEVW